MITDASGDCVGLITEATLSQDAQVAWQATYEPYGTLIDSRSLVPHPHLKAGHKGLFAERLDGGVVTGMLGVDRGRLEPGATLLYHNRNRTFSPTLGRFLQSDPNASGLAVIGSVSYSGTRAMVDVMGADLGAMTGDGVGLYGYLRGNPISGSDPTGLFGILDLAIPATTGMDLYMDYNTDVMTHGGSLGGFASGIMSEYMLNGVMDADWAMDWSQPDDLYSGSAAARMRTGSWAPPPTQQAQARGPAMASDGLDPRDWVKPKDQVEAFAHGFDPGARGVGVYVVIDPGTKKILYAGRSINLGSRMKSQITAFKAACGGRDPIVKGMSITGGNATDVARGLEQLLISSLDLIKEGKNKINGVNLKDPQKATKFFAAIRSFF